ncbi:hypothetical protein [Actinomyces oricola]|uniref:hypothetical protein n=1 Tax=Actinomyces oricola TaxID=206043 RepID=UPI0013E8E0CF|nr:hypothetical protein [Actinomyces oricola]
MSFFIPRRYRVNVSYVTPFGLRPSRAALQCELVADQFTRPGGGAPAAGIQR